MKCFGGPLHLQNHEPNPAFYHDRFEIPSVPPSYIYDWNYDPEPYYCDLGYITSTYMILRYRDNRGNMYREIEIAVYEGQLLPREEREMQWELDPIPWKPTHEPSFLYEFERWWNLMMYRRTGKVCYLYGEFRLPSRRAT